MVSALERPDVAGKTEIGDAAADLEQRVPLVGFVRDETSAAVLRESLSRLIGAPADVRCGSFPEAIKAFSGMLCPQVILVDISGEANALEALTALTGVVEPDVKVLVVGDVKDLNFYREMKQSLGVTEYLYKPLTTDLVSRVFGPVFSKVTADRSVLQNIIVSVTGAGGGAGGSTIVVNLAKFLADRMRRNTLVYDPNWHSGTCGSLLDIEPTTSMKMLFESPERVDRFVLQRSLQRIDERLTLLAGDLNYQMSINYVPGAIEHTLQLMENKFNYIIADVAMHNRAVSSEFLQHARQRIVVVEPTLSSLKEAVKIFGINVIQQASNQPIVILNKSDLPGGLESAQIADVLQRKPDIVIPYIPAEANACGNLGEALFTKSDIYLDCIKRIAAMFDSKVQATTTSSSLGLVKKLSRLISRQSA